MRKILTSLLVIAALGGIGVFSTGAYFQTSQTGPQFTFTAGTANLQITQEGGNFNPTQKIGPGFDQWTCVGIKNTGDFALRVTQSLAFTAGDPNLETALFASLNPNSTCSGYGTDYTLDQYANNPQVVAASLAVGAKIFVVERYHWNETGADQSSLMGKTLSIVGTISGQTLP